VRLLVIAGLLVRQFDPGEVMSEIEHFVTDNYFVKQSDDTGWLIV